MFSVDWRCGVRSNRCYRVQVADASILVLSFPDAVSLTPSGPRLEIPAGLAPLVTRNTFILLNKTDLVPTSVLTAALSALPQPPGSWAVSIASKSRTDEFLAGLATELQDRCDGFPTLPPLVYGGMPISDMRGSNRVRMLTSRVDTISSKTPRVGTKTRSLLRMRAIEHTWKRHWGS